LDFSGHARSVPFLFLDVGSAAIPAASRLVWKMQALRKNAPPQKAAATAARHERRADSNLRVSGSL